jgi:sulfatase maturation enzyme AslB (radical SAM superfamily)
MASMRDENRFHFSEQGSFLRAIGNIEVLRAEGQVCLDPDGLDTRETVIKFTDAKGGEHFIPFSKFNLYRRRDEDSISESFRAGLWVWKEIATDLVSNVKTDPELTKPPKSAEFLAYMLLPRSDRENVLGDLAEEYPSIVMKFGQRRAQIYFYKQVLASIWPLVRKSLVKWGAVGWIVQWLRLIG